MIKLICYGSKTLHLKEAYRSYAGERKFTSVQIVAADEMDGHKLSELTTSLHILLGTEEDVQTLNFKNDNTAEYQLDEKYTANVGTIGFYLKFSSGEADEEVVGLTNTIYIDISDNRINESTTTGGSVNGGNGGTNGKNGVTYVPKISEDGILSWTNDGGLPNPTPVNIKGDGKSAYQIAVDNGFEGSEEEWLESLMGSDYILTETDKQDIADIVVEMIPDGSEVEY